MKLFSHFSREVKYANGSSIQKWSVWTVPLKFFKSSKHCSKLRTTSVRTSCADHVRRWREGEIMVRPPSDYGPSGGQLIKMEVESIY